MNVIVIMEDSLRKDHLGCYGNKWIKTPNIDRFAEKSTVFNYAYAEGLPTLPVRVALFTGRYTLPFQGWGPLKQNDIPIAEILWDKGITSALISDTYHMHKPRMGFCRGFDYVIWIRGQESDPAVINQNVKVDLSKFSEKNWHPLYKGQPSRIIKKQFEQYLRNSANWQSEEDHHIAQVVKAGIKWLEDMVRKGKKDKLFLWLDSFDPHEPWDPPTHYTDLYPVPEYDGLPIIWGGGFVEDWTLAEIRHIRSQYAGTITMVDKWTGIFLEKVEDLGLLENTMIILLSDHGEPLGEHGIIKKIQPWPYEELSHIPLIIRLPDGMESKKYCNTFVGTQDIAPTILAFFGIDIPKFMQGRNLLPIILGEEEEICMDFGISGFYKESWSIRNYEWSFYTWLGRQMTDKREPELYRYNPNYVPPKPSDYELGDQAEKENLIKEEPNIAENLEKKLRDFINKISKHGSTM